MTPQQIDNLEIVTRIQILQQCTLHQIDELSHSTLYKREHKQRFENFYAYVSKLVETLTDAFKPIEITEDMTIEEIEEAEKQNKLLKKEMGRYVEVCNEIDKVLTKVTIEA